MINDDFFFNDLCRGIFRIGYEFVLITEAVLVFNSNQHARGYPIEVLNTLYITFVLSCRNAPPTKKDLHVLLFMMLFLLLIRRDDWKGQLCMSVGVVSL